MKFSREGIEVAPIQEKTAKIASPFIDPFGSSLRTFFLILGPCKALGVFSLWNMGPMPQWFGRIGLTFSAGCATYGHYKVGDSIIVPVGYIGLISCLSFVELL
ncbi:hypothetical protein FRACYDRAFT_249943 [Fragilariopsis cylindrus CCMP1102]|uniref:Uncharacterized protein n=1 Tax=Fragilariopsis cylindrus CCMP1102 TaxID=635003 RepID=A0A1E7ER91_9STRA|nr:hypothetical protein FRACYDRAFT_249943 [Fragilariopsis cylindrus CCMP1102]|eukprot:OEU08498.1 hypothetical protein FRACYDRAFT_249943 [Fragilariopsis cylindrus CCMP1102]